MLPTGYGSLIDAVSRAKTVPELAQKVVTPVLVKGLERVWAKRTIRGMTAMGVRFVPNAECVGVLLPVDDKELARFDRREKGYFRAKLNLDDVEPVPFLDDGYYKEEDHSIFLSAKADDKLQDAISIWVYVQKKPLPPTPKHPIVQSYVDTILRGCLHISDDFAKDFIANSKGWSPSELTELRDELEQETDISDDGSDDDEIVWVDDRDDPVYERSDREWSLQQARKLDRLLQKYRPKHFRNRKPLDDIQGPKE